MKSDTVHQRVTRYRRLAAEAERRGRTRDGRTTIEALQTAALWRFLADDIELNLGEPAAVRRFG